VVTAFHTRFSRKEEGCAPVSCKRKQSRRCRFSAVDEGTQALLFVTIPDTGRALFRDDGGCNPLAHFA
jgi:hypothetical protein